MTGGRDISLEGRRHPRGWVRLLLRASLQPGLFWQIDLMLNTGRPQSVVSPTTRNALAALGLIEPNGTGRFRIPRVRVGDDLLPDLHVRVSAGPALLGVDGMLGWDYLERFAEVRIEPRTLRITFVPL
jgi:hypothetical protein